MWIDVDAAVTVPVNAVALIDDGDFKSREESVTYDQAGLDLVWNFVTTAGVQTQTAVTPTDTGGAYDWVNVGNGMYNIEIPATDPGGGTIWNDTEGFGWFSGFATGVLPWSGPIIGFRAAGLNDKLCNWLYSPYRGLAGTALPNANADAAFGLPTSDAGGLDLDDLPKRLDRNADLVESQRGSHTWQGNAYYVTLGGNDSTGDGSRALPYLTLQAAHDDLITTGNHDVIFLGPGTHSTAATITLSKDYFFIRGKGRNSIVTRTGNGDTLALTGDGIELSGFQVGTATSGSGHGIKVTAADFMRGHHLWLLATQGDGIHLLRASNCQIHDNDFEGTGVGGSGQGIHIVGTGGASNGNAIFDNEMHGTLGTAILIEQGTTNDTLIYHNDIHDAGGWGINIGASSTRAVVYDNILGNNSSGDINDGGTDSIVKRNRDWLSSTTESRTLDVNATGEAGLDLDNTSGTIDANQIGADAITAAKIATGAFTADAFAADALIAATFATGAFTADAFAADALVAATFKADYYTAIEDELVPYFQLTLRSDAAIATDRSAQLAIINADETTGPGDYSSITASQEAATAALSSMGGTILVINTKLGAYSGIGADTVLGGQTAIIAKTGQLNFTGDDVKATLDGEEVTTDAASRTASKADLTAVAKTGADSDTLETISDQIDTLSALSGEGAFTGTLTVNDGATGLEGVVVNARRGGVLIASGITDVNGQITNWVFGAFTYDLAARLSGFEPDTDTLTVSANGWTKTISLTANTIDPPPSAATTTGVGTYLDEKGVEEQGVEVTVQILEGPGDDGLGYDSAEWGETSDVNGVVQFAGIIKGAKYTIWRGDEKSSAETFTAPLTGTSFNLKEVIGQG